MDYGPSVYYYSLKYISKGQISKSQSILNSCLIFSNLKCLFTLLGSGTSNVNQIIFVPISQGTERE